MYMARLITPTLCPPIGSLNHPKSLLKLVPNGLGSGGKGGRCSGSCGKGCHSPMYVSIDVAE